VRGTSSDVPVSLISRFTNLRTAATHSLGNELWQLFKLRSFAMRTMDLYKNWLFPLRNSQLRNTLPDRLSLIGGGK
jgi:hypothetical protein